MHYSHAHGGVREVTNSLRALLQVAQPPFRRMWSGQRHFLWLHPLRAGRGCRPGLQRVPAVGMNAWAARDGDEPGRRA
jgi:hypothetical protein